MRLEIINKHTGEYPNLRSIARRCKWAKHLIYCDMDGFALDEDDQLILMDECGNIAYCPPDRFKVEIIQEPIKVKQERTVERLPFKYEKTGFCPKCSQVLNWPYHKRFCGYCGQAVEWNEGEQP